ncbi:MAG: pilus assembly PilX N-terminal domain-containing protein [Candidatus Daviesbacteria bacterium]|nr:pilus assembly PilX N-terminal domain-containing protein [Candidatus Daviesbacteria bacterium]
MRSEKGQVVLILVLVMTVALAIGISVIQRSLSDVSTSSKVEQSSRAFSAAEAGIEKSIQSGANVSSTDLGNNATIDGAQVISIPAAGNALEYPLLAKEEMAQVWLADPVTLTATYNQPAFKVYFGTPGTADEPAIEVTVVSKNGADYISTKKFFDSDSTRIGTNGFSNATCNNNHTVRTDANTSDSTFACVATVNGYSGIPILVRLRLLYSSTSQPVAVAPTNPNFPLPLQAKIYTATGISGQTQRRIQVRRFDKVVPHFFDYAVFSVGDINK